MPTPEFEPTDEMRERVKALSGYGMPQLDIARLVKNPRTEKGISLKTLLAHFRDELDDGMAIANAAVAQAAHAQAAGRPAEYDKNKNLLRAEVKPVPTMTIYWTKARMGWREPIVHELDWGIDELDRAIRDAKARRDKRLQAAADAGESSEAPGAENAAGGRTEVGDSQGNGQVRPLSH